MFCRNCGKQIHDDAAFCPFCGNVTPFASVQGAGADMPVPVKAGFADPGLAAARKKGPGSIVLGVALILLTIAEFYYWTMLSQGAFYTGFSWAPLGEEFLQQPMGYLSFTYLGTIALLLGPVVGILIAIYLLTRNSKMFRAASIYGIVSSAVILFLQVLREVVYFVEAGLDFRWSALNPWAELCLVSVTNVLMIVFFIMLFVLYKTGKIAPAIAAEVVIFLHDIGFTLLYTRNGSFSSLKSWLRYKLELFFDFREYPPYAMILFIISLAGVVLHSVFVWNLYYRRKRQLQ